MRRASLIALALAIAVSGPAFTRVGTGHRPPPETAIPTDQPRFKIEAINFKAIDESGYDWPFADEVFAVFEAGGYVASTDEEGDVDAGETRDFRLDQNCVLPVLTTHLNYWACDPHGAAGPLSFTVSLYEADGSPFVRGRRFSGAYPSGTTIPQIRARDGDDLIGRKTLTFSLADLITSMPAPGATWQNSVTLGKPCHDPGFVCHRGPGPTGPEYRFRYRITRLPDVRVELPAVF